MASKDGAGTAVAEVDAIIEGVGGWKGQRMAQIRALVKEADPDVVEEVKWKKPSNPAGVPTYYHDGMIGTLQAFKSKVKFTFANGAELEDPEDIFNASLGGNAMRAIDLHEGDKIDEAAFKSLVRAAVALNEA